MDKTAQFWDKSVNRFNICENPYDWVKDELLLKIPKYLHPNADVLDIGCAAGKYSIGFAPEVKSVLGIDLSAAMIDAAKLNASEHNISNVEFVQASISDVSLKSEYFQIVLALNILHLVENPQQTIVDIRKVLKPGGLFISVTPCLASGISIQASLIKFMSKCGMIPKLHAFKLTQAKNMICAGKFGLIESQIIGSKIPKIFIVARRTA